VFRFLLPRPAVAAVDHRSASLSSSEESSEEEEVEEVELDELESVEEDDGKLCR
jgi:hypothetical protein